jgi:hypothetical protein
MLLEGMNGGNCMSKKTNCPNCGSASTTKGKVDQRRTLNAFDFVPMAPWSCGDCGQVWEPPAPKWALVLFLLLGLLLLGVTAFVIAIGDKHWFRQIIRATMGIVIIVGCIGRLRNRAPTIITPGRKPGVASQ